MLSNKQTKINKSDLARKLNSARENKIELTEPVTKETLAELNDQ